MKRFLALLFLVLCSPAVTQQIDWTNAVNVQNVVINPTMNDCQSGVPTCGAWMEGGGFAPGDWSNGSYTFSYFQNTLYQDIDLSQYNTNMFNFTFSFDLNNSCRNSIGGYCENVNGPIDFISAKIYFYDTNGLNNQFTFLNGNISTADIVCNGLDILGVCFLGYSAQDNWQSFGWYSHVQSDFLFTSARIEFTGRDVGFWGGLYGPRVDNASLQINYLPYIPEFLYWNPLSGEYQTFTLTEEGVVRYGANGVYAYQTLQAGTYECGNALFGDPIGGVVKACELGSNTPLVVTVDCATDPFNVSCVIDTLGIDDGVVDYTDPEQVLASLEDDTATDTSVDTGADDGSSDGTEIIADEEEVLVADSATEEEVNLEEMLQEEETTDEEEVVVANNNETVVEKVNETASSTAVYKELSDDEKAQILADSISKNTLEGALAIAADATSASSSSGGSQTTESSSTSSRSTTTSSGSLVAQESSSSSNENKTEELKQESVDASSSEAMDILETGRQIGATALASTLADSASSANESVAQAESIASGSAESSVSAAVVVDIRTDISTVADVNIDIDTTNSFTDTSSTTDESVNVMSVVENQTTDSGQVDSFADIMQLEIKPETGEFKNDEVEFIQQLAAASNEQKKDEDVNNSGFSEEEKVTIANDPALANAFNLAPNITNLEAAGVLGSKQEEKSDAEKRAEEVVAANKEEQDKINSNYMDADQSGIVAAMGADVDVASYRTAMIRDNNIWYKPEDIYKNIVYKDNVRGAYFLEKGNTDTYKKMVEEQYK